MMTFNQQYSFINGIDHIHSLLQEGGKENTLLAFQLLSQSLGKDKAFDTLYWIRKDFINWFFSDDCFMVYVFGMAHNDYISMRLNGNYMPNIYCMEYNDSQTFTVIEENIEDSKSIVLGAIDIVAEILGLESDIEKISAYLKTKMDKCLAFKLLPSIRAKMSGAGAIWLLESLCPGIKDSLGDIADEY